MALPEKIVLFLHIPKTAGTTLSKCIHREVMSRPTAEGAAGQLPELTSKQFVHDGLYYYPIGFFKDPALEPLPYVQRCLERTDLRAIVGHFSYGLHRCLAAPATYMTLLRHPVDRVLSLYGHLQALGMLKPGVGLDEFVDGCPPGIWATRLGRWHPMESPFPEEEIRDRTRAIVDNDQTRRLSGSEPGFGECDHSHLQAAVDHLRRHFVMVGTCERFDESLTLAGRRLGWAHPPLYLPRLVNKRKTGSKEVSPRSLALIEERNALDLELYRIANEMMDEAIAEEGPAFREDLQGFVRLNQDHIDEHRTAIRQMAIGADTSPQTDET